MYTRVKPNTHKDLRKKLARHSSESHMIDQKKQKFN